MNAGESLVIESLFGDPDVGLADQIQVIRPDSLLSVDIFNDSFCHTLAHRLIIRDLSILKGKVSHPIGRITRHQK